MAKLITALALIAEVQAQTNLTSSGKTGTVYIIRHGEKDSQGCESSTGMKRANNMYDVFNAKFDVPEYVFAYTYEGSESWECQRCIQTAVPIAKRIGMSPDAAYGTNTCSNNWGPPSHCLIFGDAIKDKLSDHDIVMVVAEHQHIPRIAYGLGVPRSEIPDWSGSDYDTVFKVKFSNGKLDSFSVDKQGQFGPSPSPSPSPPPSSGYKYISTFIDTMSASNSGMITYQIGVKLKGGAATVYTIIGSSKGALTIPAAWQKKTFGKNLGGVNKDIVKIFKDAGYDSWLTVGITGGDGSNELGSAGLKDALKVWSPAAGGFGKGFTNKDCGVFWMNPAKSRALGVIKGKPQKIVLGQLTLKEGVKLSAAMGVAGKDGKGKTWREDKVTFKN